MCVNCDNICLNMTTQEKPPHPSKLDGLSIKMGKIQPPIGWFRCQFNQTCGLDLNEEQITPLLDTDKQGFVPDIPEQIQTPIRNHVSDALINHHFNQQIQWNQMVDLQRMVNAMPFAHLNHLN